jgi:hypothetical protein
VRQEALRSISQESTPAYLLPLETIQPQTWSLAHILRNCIRAAPIVVLGAFAAALLASAAILLFRAAVPQLATYRSGITLTMSGADPGKYPNGTEFAPSDMRAPIVLSAVHDDNNLSDRGIDLPTFAGMVTVEAYSPILESTIDRYRKRLDNKQLTFEERKLVEAEFSASMGSILGRDVVVGVTVSDSWHVSKELGTKLASDIPAKWADIYVNQLGAARLPVSVSGTALVDRALLAGLDYPLAYDYLDELKRKLGSRISEISALPGASTLMSHPTGKSLADLQRSLEAVSEFRMRRVLQPIVDLGLTKSPKMTAITYENMIENLNLTSRSTAERSQLVSGIVTDVDANGSRASAQVGGGSGFSTAGMMPQMDGTFVDKIIELSSKGSGVAFREDLLQRKLGLENDGVSTKELSTRFAQRLGAIKEFDTLNDTNPELVPTFVQGAASVAAEMDTLWTETNNILEQVNLKRLNFDKALYKSSELAGNVVISREPLLTQRMILIVAAASVLGALIAAAAFAIRQILAARTQT